jgi:peptidoglycan/xylan/chitin deacetylase (PgdA/CDA1 family)
MLDLDMDCCIPREANLLRTDTNAHALFAGELSAGYAVLLPFDVEAALADARIVRKSFYSTRDRLPFERVSLVSKGEVRHLLRWAFDHLHRVQGLPYLHLWYYPGGTQSLFSFRVDTDGGSRAEIDTLYHVARTCEVPVSWFLDVKSHEPWLEHFRSFAGHEFGVHCFEHRTFTRYEENLRNISAAERRMKAAGLAPEGFAAPFGMWNAGLGRALRSSGFAYSSEFGFACDTLPLHPVWEGVRVGPLQVPIHPVSIGNLRQAGYTDRQMMDYYRRVIDEKICRAEPLFFYHHPTHRCWKVVEWIFTYVREQGIPNATFGRYARWWNARDAATTEFSVDGDVVGAVCGGEEDRPDVFVRVVSPGGKDLLTRCDSALDLRLLPLTLAEPCAPVPEDIRRIREADPRAALANLYTSFLRKFR